MTTKRSTNLKSFMHVRVVNFSIVIPLTRVQIFLLWEEMNVKNQYDKISLLVDLFWGKIEILRIPVDDS